MKYLKLQLQLVQRIRVLLLKTKTHGLSLMLGRLCRWVELRPWALKSTEKNQRKTLYLFQCFPLCPQFLAVDHLGLGFPPLFDLELLIFHITWVSSFITLSDSFPSQVSIFFQRGRRKRWLWDLIPLNFVLGMAFERYRLHFWSPERKMDRVIQPPLVISLLYTFLIPFFFLLLVYMPFHV